MPPSQRAQDDPEIENLTVPQGEPPEIFEGRSAVKI
jgi:hypothetical protein